MKKVFVSTESSEYDTLRNEILDLLRHSRQVLYWTIGFVILGMGWYVAQEPAKALPLWLFSLFLFLMVFVSVGAYTVNTQQIYRIGGFLAVFWESRDPETYRFWHRLNRRGPSGGFLPDAATLVYTSLVVTLTAFFIAGSLMGYARPWEPMSFIILLLLSQIVALSQLSRYLRQQRDRYESVWRVIKESPEMMATIHNRYEAEPVPPPRIIFP